MNRHDRWRLRARAGILALALGIGVTGLAAPAAAVSPDAVISQVYGGGGNSGAPYSNDYIELFNRGTSTVSLAGWSVQYTSATGTGNFGSSTTLITPLSGSLAPGQYLLVQEAAGATPSTPLPTPDVTDSTPINMAAGGGKVALVNTTTPLGCNGGSMPCSAAALATIVDLIGWDGANFFEGSVGPTTTNTTAAFRQAGGCTDTDDNGADFALGAPTPRNSASPFTTCSTSTDPTGVGAAVPSAVFPGDSSLLSVAVTPGTDPTSTGLAVAADLSAIGGSAAQAFFDDGSNGDATAGDDVYSFQATVSASTTPGAKSLPATITDAEARGGSASISLTVRPPLVPIHDIQGAGHVSPYNGTSISTDGVVTAVRTNGFYVQDASPDADVATSEGVFVFTSSTPAVSVGDSALVSGTVSEFRPGGASSANLATTEISGSPAVAVQSTGNPLPSPTVIGNGGRVPPSEVIEDDATGDVETSGVFDPASDGIDFYESLEGMRVQVNDAVAVGPTNPFGETPVIGDDGANASVRTARGGIVVRATDFNPERIILDDLLVPMPIVNVGDHYPGAVLGVLDYNFGNFMVEVTSAPAAVSGGLAPETTGSPSIDQVSIGTFNVENLDPLDPASKFDRLAGLIVDNLQAPDIVAVEEMQDDNGPTDDGTVGAGLTFATLIAAIQSAGGPTYDFRQIDPVNDQDGGEPGGNIRVGFLFRTDRGLSFIDRPGGTSTAATTVVGSGSGTQLSFSPGRIDPTNPAFTTSRKPLAGEFSFRGHHLFVIANHFNSKGGDNPLFGHFQPPTRISEVQRHEQAQVVHDFVADLLAADPDANVVLVGDLNDFEFSDALTTLRGTILNDLIETLPQSERYTYEFEGNAQTLDHILLSDAPFGGSFAYDVVHVNAEFADQASDHDPQVVRISLNEPPTVDAGGPYTVVEGGSVVVSATGSDPEGGALSYAWDLDDNGSFETPGQSATFSAAALTAPGTHTITVRVTDDGGLTATDTATVYVIYVFSGFFAPVDNLPVLNTVKAGQAVPVKFSLDGDQGLAIFAAGYPRSEQIACDSTEPTDGIEETVAPGNSGLSYDAATDHYTYVWKTNKAWANTCRQLVILLDDGTFHRANFKFKK
jgi:predicted extracellular nuclease